MESRARLFGHPIHQQLIVFPLGLLLTSFIFDLIYLATKNGTWGVVSFWMIAAGIVGGLVAAPFGLVDWLAIPPGTRAKAVGGVHGLGNVAVLLLFAASWFARYDAPQMPGNGAILMSLAGAVLSIVTGWLGGELVTRLGIGVFTGAHPDAPSSLHDTGQKPPETRPLRRAG